MRGENEQLRGENSRLEQELVCQQRMANQIQEIIQFVADGKERQELLQDVTARLAGELDSFKRGLHLQQQHQQQQQITPLNNGQRAMAGENNYANTPSTSDR
jgi:CHASE3 domain sensor protein